MTRLSGLGGAPGRNALLAAASIVSVAIAGASAASRPEPFDLLVRGARIVDGSGGAWYRAD
ncbi:MAG: hypothetical protein M3R62_05195, partial [Acidobacteriota bacterium]|nr:hypothetical protein [Acidobacteriota bacterium]